jgi:hypothetical protein
VLAKETFCAALGSIPPPTLQQWLRLCPTAWDTARVPSGRRRDKGTAQIGQPRHRTLFIMPALLSASTSFLQAWVLSVAIGGWGG